MTKIQWDFNPKPEEIINIEGTEQETLFWHLKSWLITDHVEDLQAQLDEMWSHYREIEDERLLALVGALCVESALDNLLESFIEGYCSLAEDLDFTFSMKIKLAKALHLIPGKILNSCDLVRAIRNDFAHNLEISHFAQLRARHINKLAPYVREYTVEQRDWKDYVSLYRRLIGFTILGLASYSFQLRKLKEYLKTDEFRASFFNHVNGKVSHTIERSMSMPVSDSQKAQIYNHLQNAGVRNFCPACNQDVEWKQADVVTVLGITDTLPDVSRGIPLIPVICKNCGYVRFFSAKSIGLF